MWEIDLANADIGREQGRNDPTVLQTIVLPEERRADRLGLYVRYPKGHVRLADPDGLPIEAGSVLDLCTFFNAFSHRKWHDLTGVRDVGVRLAGHGTVEISIATYHASGAAWPLLKQSVTLTPDPTDLWLPVLGSFEGEVLGLTISAGSEARLTSGAWMTRDTPKRTVHLAAVITTFRRAAETRRTMATFSDTVCRRAPHGSVSLYVIDNGGDLEASTLPGVVVVQNPNLGGAGGFARGLIEVIDAGHFTHALLMDDDAACEPESVWRTMAFMAFTDNTKAAMSGAMLLNEHPCLQYEKGAALVRHGEAGLPWATNRHMCDVSLLREVCSNERDGFVNYGGWWFFAFALAAVETMPFPFFVRGDDVDFSLSNNLETVTMNGIAAWCDGFGTKLGAATEYLAYRAWLALMLMHGDEAAARRTLRFSLKTAERLAYRFDYNAMEAVLDALSDVMEGPDTFTKQPAPLEKLRAYRSNAPQSLQLDDFNRLQPQKWVGTAKTWAKLPFSGHVFAPLSRLAKDVRYARQLYEFDRWGLGGASKAVAGEGTDLQVFAFDRRAFLKGLRRVRRLRKLIHKLPDVEAQYKAIKAPVRTRAFWEPLFERPS